MKATELRIGNWINTIEGPAQVKAISEGGIMTTSGMPDGDHLEFAEPIPLTTEMLKKCLNFKEGLYTLQGLRGYFVALHLDGNVYAEYFIRHCSVCKVEFLHQLQNLYFALTGKELEIKL